MRRISCNVNIHGLLTALITPFADGAIDYDALAVLVRRAAISSNALVVLGTTAEPCSLSMEEKESIVRFVLQSTAKPVVVGLTGNDTPRVVQCARRYSQLGASALLCVTPYYNRCNAEGLLAHYRAIAQAVEIPIILYNVPARTGVNITPETLSRLLTLPHVVGVKQASSDAMQIMHYATVCASLSRTLYCGDDAMLPLFRSVGAEGIISAAANAIPDVMAEGMYMPMGDMPRWVTRYLPLVECLFGDVNPIRVKEACYHLGLIRNELRLPLVAGVHPPLVTLLARANYAIVNQ